MSSSHQKPISSQASFKYGATKMEIGTKVWIRNDTTKASSTSASSPLWLAGEVTGKTVQEDGASHVTATAEGMAGKTFKFIIPPGQDDTNDLMLRNGDVEGVGDNLINLPYLNEPELLACLQARYERYVIYTYTGPVLIAINPYDTLHSGDDVSSLKGNELFESFIRSIKARRPAPAAQITEGESEGSDVANGVSKHSILISGESGSGKTECAKKIIQILVSRDVSNTPSNTASSLSPMKGMTASVRQSKENVIVNKVLLASSILKAFGNATTLHSLNSSRFGQYVNIAFDEDNDVVFATFKTYLLENIRVVHQLRGERNFHIFYEVFAGVSEEERRQLQLHQSISFRYISPQIAAKAAVGNTAGRRQLTVDTKAATVSASTGNRQNDAEEFNELRDHLLAIGFEEDDCQLIFQLIAGILHLGQVQFQPRNDVTGEGSEIVEEDEGVLEGETHLQLATRLCRLTSEEVLRKCLVEKTIVLQVRDLMGSRSETVTKQHTASQAMHTRDALAKAMYMKLFDFLAQEINRFLSPSLTSATSAAVMASVKSTIGILDIFGFDSFEDNSFEQLCINYANESLQQQFNQQMFKFQLAEYSSEQIVYESVRFADNQDCMELIGNGIFRSLDDQCRLPDPSDKKFMNALYKDYATHPRFLASSTQRANYSFTVDHYAGKVVYDSEGFIQKNIDELPATAQALMRDSANKLLNHAPLAPSSSTTSEAKDDASVATAKPATAPGRQPTGQGQRTLTTRNTTSAVAQFKAGLASLIQHVSCTTPHYIRCVNPIDRADLTLAAATTPLSSTRAMASMMSGRAKTTFDQHHVAAQLRYGGILEAVRVARLAYPVRYPHVDFLQRYLILLPPRMRQGGVAEVVAIVSAIKKQLASNAPLTDAMKAACLSLLQLLTSHCLSVSLDNVQVGRTKVFFKTHEHEVLETLRSHVTLAALRTLLRFLWRFYQQRREIIQARQRRALMKKQGEKAVRIQAQIRRFLAQKKRMQLRNLQFLKSISHDEEAQLATHSVDHESLASYNTDVTGVFSASDGLPPHIAAMGRKARKARAHKQLGAKINEYKQLDDVLLQEVTKLLEAKRKFDEWTILRFDVSQAKKQLAEWAQAFSPTDSPVLRTKTQELAKTIDYGYVMLLPDKLIPMNMIGKAFSFGRNISADARTNSAKSANKVVTKEHKIFKSIYKALDQLKDVIDVFSNEKNGLEDRQALMSDSAYSYPNHTTSDVIDSSSAASSSMQAELTQIATSLELVTSVLEVSKMLYQYYLQYVAHTVREFGENSPFKAQFKADEVAYILAFASVLETRHAFLSAEKSDEALKKKVLADNQFLRTLSLYSLHETYFLPPPPRSPDFLRPHHLLPASSEGKGRPLSYSVGRADVAGLGVANSDGSRVVCKLITASPGSEYVINCLIQLLAGEILMFPIKLIKLLGKGSRNYGQVAFYQAALHFSEDTLRSSVSSKDVQQAAHQGSGSDGGGSTIDSKSYSIVFLATILAGVTRCKPDNFMTKRRGDVIEIIGVNNDEDLTKQLFAPKEFVKAIGLGPAHNAYHALALLPLFHKPIDATVREALLAHSSSGSSSVEETITSLLREIYLQNKRYESLLTSGFSTKDLLTLQVPIEMSKVAAIRLYKKMNVVWAALRERNDVTHFDLLCLLYPSLTSMYTADVINKRVGAATIRSNDFWLDFYPTGAGVGSGMTPLMTPTSSFHLGGGAGASKSFYLNRSIDPTSAGIAISLEEQYIVMSASTSAMNLVSLVSAERATIEEVSTEFIKCVDFQHLLRSAGSSGDVSSGSYELFAAGNISDNLSFLPTLWLRRVSEEQLVIMFGGLIENAYRSLYVTPPSKTDSTSSVQQPAPPRPTSTTVERRAAVISSKLFLRTLLLVGIESSMRKELRGSDVVQCLESVLNVRVAFAEQDISHYRIYSNEEIEDEDDDAVVIDEEVDEEVSYDEFDDRLDFFQDLEDDATQRNDLTALKALQSMKRALQHFIVNYIKEVRDSGQRSDREVQSDIDVVVEVVQTSYEQGEGERGGASAFSDTIASLHLLEFCTLLLQQHHLLYAVALPLAERGIFNHHQHILQYLLIQTNLEAWERLIVQIVHQQPRLVFMKNSVDFYLPCDRIKQLTLNTPSNTAALAPSTPGRRGKGIADPHLVHYRLLTAMFNTTYHLFVIKPTLLNEFFHRHLDEYLSSLNSGGRSAAAHSLTGLPKHPPIDADIDEELLSVDTEKILTQYSDEEDVIFYAVRYGFFATVEEVQQKRFNFNKRIYVNAEGLGGGVGKDKDLQYNLIQCCLYLSKRTDITSDIEKENRKTMEAVVRAIEQRMATASMTKDQLYDLIYTNGQGKIIVSNSSQNKQNSDFLKQLTAFLA
eukprot:gene12836-14063_t